MSDWLDLTNNDLMETPVEGDYITIQERVPVATDAQRWGTYAGITRTTEPFWRAVQSTNAFQAPAINWAEIDREMERQARQREEAMMFQRIYQQQQVQQMINSESSLWASLIKDGRHGLATEYPEELRVAPGL